MGPKRHAATAIRGAGKARTHRLGWGQAEGSNDSQGRGTDQSRGARQTRACMRSRCKGSDDRERTFLERVTPRAPRIASAEEHTSAAELDRPPPNQPFVNKYYNVYIYISQILETEVQRCL